MQAALVWVPIHMIRVVLISILLCSWTPNLSAQVDHLDKKDLKTVVSFLVGTYGTDTQVAGDSSTYRVMLHVLPLWPKSKTGYWLYWEQASSDDPEKPYRQRVYNLYLEGDTVIVSQMYEIDNASRYAGAWKDPSKLDDLTSASIVHREGCGLSLHKASDGSFHGSTPIRDCPSGLRGAAYATSEWTLKKDEVTTWERGFDLHGVQVWGPVRGPYVFMKQTENQH